VRRAPTLRGRLALVAVVTTAVWVGLLTAGFNLLLASQLHAQASSLLRQRAAAAADAVQVGADGTVRFADPHDDSALDTDLWIYAGSKALERPRASRRLQQEADALAASGNTFAQTAEPGATRFYALRLRENGRPVATVVAGVSLDPYRNVARLALLGSTGLALLLLAGVYAVTRLLVGRALAPVQEMSAQAARWSEADASQRFGAADRPGELALLAANLDGVLDRLAALLRHEQLVTEELSHELRTPLSLITAETDLLRGRRRTSAELHQAVDRIADSATRMSRILETLLSAARSRSSDSAGRCLLEPVVTAAVGTVAVAVAVDPGPPGLLVGVDADLVERMLAPILDNAQRYAATRIDVTVAIDGPSALVRIRDDGPGVAPELGDAVFDPGRRDAGSSPQGAGLGLALARRLARAAGGDVVLVGGAFEVRLPRG
jgi:signal transduction histidine kinase